jgi:hypothetical protein
MSTAIAGVDFTGSTSNQLNYWNMGYSFHVDSPDVTVTALGAYDVLPPTLSDGTNPSPSKLSGLPQNVGLWDLTTNSFITSVVVDGSSFQAGDFAYTQISPIALNEGDTYYVGSQGGGPMLNWTSLVPNTSISSIETEGVFVDGGGTPINQLVVGNLLPDGNFDAANLLLGDGSLKLGASNAAPAACDFNGDHVSDILWRDANTGDTVAFLMNGGSVASTVEFGGVSQVWQVAGIGNFNGTGTSSILWRNTVSGDDAIYNLSDGTVSSITNIGPIGTAWAVVGVGDFNGDGTDDLLWRNAITGGDVISNMHAGTIASMTDIGGVGTAWTVAGTGDFNGDGTTDLLWRNTASGDTVIFSMNGSSVASTTDLGVIGTNWAVAGVGDFNGDRTSDILWRNTVTGDIVVFLMSGNSVASASDLGTVNTAWTVAEVGDFNGDGNADILLRNTSEANVEFLMTGASVTSPIDVGGVGTNWSVQKPVLSST